MTEQNLSGGIKPKLQTPYVDFGMYIINKQKLIDDNRLAVKYQSKSSISLFPSQIISDKLRDILLDLLDNQNLSPRSYQILNQDLSTREKDLLNNLLKRAKLDYQLGLGGYRNEDYNKQLQRYDLLRGQILAGNNNPEIMKELKLLILTFMQSGKMRRSEGNQLIWELETAIKEIL